MENFEMQISSLRDYEKGRAERMAAGEIAKGGLYVATAALKRSYPFPAIKFPAEILEVEPDTEYMRFRVLDCDPPKQRFFNATFSDNFLRDVSRMPLGVQSAQVFEGYFIERYRWTDVYEELVDAEAGMRAHLKKADVPEDVSDPPEFRPHIRGH